MTDQNASATAYGGALIAKPANIHAKMLAVMDAIGSIPRTGHNDHFNYDFIEEEKVSETVRSLLVKQGIAFHPNVTSHEKQGTITILGMDLVFVNCERPEEEVRITTYGYGLDTQDKGASKALTSGIKYGLLKTFLVPGGDDPDRAGPVTRPAPARRDPEGAARPRPVPIQGRKQEPPPAQHAEGIQEAVIHVKDITYKESAERNKAGDGPKWTKFTIEAADGQKYGTFSRSEANLAREARDSGAPLRVRFTSNKYGNDIEREGGLAAMGSPEPEPGEEIPFN